MLKFQVQILNDRAAKSLISHHKYFQSWLNQDAMGILNQEALAVKQNACNTDDLTRKNKFQT